MHLTELVAKADALVDEGIAAGFDGSHSLTVREAAGEQPAFRQVTGPE